MQKTTQIFCVLFCMAFLFGKGVHSKMIYDAIVIGGGAVGCATARELSRYDLRLALCEKGEDVCVGTSKANSAIVHAGFDAEPGTKKAHFNVAGSRMMERLSQELDFPYKRNGALVLCFNEKDLSRLEELRERGEKNGVEGLRIVSGDELHALESALSPEAVAALYAPTSAIVCPFAMTIALAENAAQNGVEFFMDTPVTAITCRNGLYEITAGGRILQARTVVNAAGVYSDALHNMVCEHKLSIVPRSGEYCLLDKKDGHLVERTVFQLPGKFGKGVLVTPTVHGNLLIGPTAVDRSDKDATNTTADGLAYATAMAERSVPNLPMRDTITSFCGLRAHLEGDADDFIIGESADGFFDAVGIESPGLSSAPAIGQYLAQCIAQKLDATEKLTFVSTRKDIPHLRELPLEQRQALVQENAAYGNIICRCEQISEGEIVDAIHRLPGARSLDGVKRRVRAGMGRCQGGFCAPRVMEILSRELGVVQTELTKSGGDSRLLVGYTKEVQE